MESSDKEFYEKLSGRALSDQEVFEAKNNFVGFFDLLYHIDRRKAESTEKNDESPRAGPK